MRITFCWKIPSLVLLCTPAQHLFYSFLLGTLCLDTKTSPLWPLRWMYMTQGREACHQEGWRKSWGPQRGLIKVAVFFLCRKLATHGGRNGTHKRLVMSAVPSFFIMESKSSIEASDWHRRVAGCELFQTTALLCVLQNCGLCKWAGWSSCHQARSNAADHCGCLVSSHVCECFWQEVPPPPPTSDSLLLLGCTVPWMEHLASSWRHLVKLFSPLEASFLKSETKNCPWREVARLSQLPVQQVSSGSSTLGSSGPLLTYTLAIWPPLSLGSTKCRAPCKVHHFSDLSLGPTDARHCTRKFISEVSQQPFEVGVWGLKNFQTYTGLFLPDSKSPIFSTGSASYSISTVILWGTYYYRYF